MNNITFNLSNITSCLKNIPSRIHNITPHFTGEPKIMSLSSTNITSRFKNITLCCSIIILCLLSITFLTGSILGISLSSNNSNSVSALTYSSTTDVSFTFAPKLSISMSDTNLVIDNLVPGQTSNSNAITITVASNTPYGYSLYADAGSNDTSSTYYNTSDLIHNDSTVSNAFTSIATNASLAQLTTDNTWGYSTSTDNGTTWSTYNGLPIATSTESSTSTNNPALLIDTKDPADSSKSIAFKVAARASTTQASGAYGNIINFYAVGKPEPMIIESLTYMQDFKGLANVDKENVLASMTEDGQYTLKDGREPNKQYYISKLRDGNVWMTQNLDFNIDSTKTYDSTNTDLPEGILWHPDTSTHTDDAWDKTNTAPESYDPGNRYWNGEVTTEGNDLEDGTTTSGDPHYHIGNFYNWTAAIATNDSGLFKVSEQDANQSICPAGWRLPTIGDDKSLQELINKGLTAGTGGNIQLDPTYFAYASGWLGDSISLGFYGIYWTSISESETESYQIRFNAYGQLNSGFSIVRYVGYNVRCVLR